MFEVAVEQSFAAAHALRGYKGKCERLHGHNYKVQVAVRGEELDEIGLLVDFVDLKRWLKQIVERLDHSHLNELEPFDHLNPSAENLARYFYEEIDRQLKAQNPGRKLHVAWVKVWETETSVATYYGPSAEPIRSAQ